jgi:transglutaminase-like putative cysteine protease
VPTEERSPRPREPLAAGSPWRAVAIATAVALASSGIISADRAGVPRIIGATAGATAGLLGVLALPTFPTRRVTLALLAFGGLAAARHAALPGVDVKILVLWALSTLAALLLLDRAQAEETPKLAGGADLPSRRRDVMRTGAFLGALVFVAVVAFAPTVATLVRRPAASGSSANDGDMSASTSSLLSSDYLDMTSRPRLSNSIVFTVQASHPDFWRGQTWDVYDGTGWQRSDPGRQLLFHDGQIVHLETDPTDPAVQNGQTMQQTFHIEAPYSNLLFAAPTPIDVQTTGFVVGRRDGTMTAVGGVGRGTVYTVWSKRPRSTEATLRAADPKAIPAEVMQRDAETPPTTARVRQLAQQITANASTNYDKVLAIEAWLAANTKYSLNAPLSPANTDVVDHFVFDTHLGWCEQVASTLVVMLRSVGVPARVATGFVTGAPDSLNGTYVVREKDAHAWAEVYFAGVGWQGFDPTASVPLAGDAAATSSWLGSARSLLPALGLLTAVAAAMCGAFMLVRRGTHRSRRPRPAWGATMLTRLERLGARAEVVHRPGQTVREFARALAVRLGEPQLVAIGGAIDNDAFSAAGAAPADRAAAEQALTGVERAVRERMSRRRRGRVVRSIGTPPR